MESGDARLSVSPLFYDRVESNAILMQEILCGVFDIDSFTAVVVLQ